MNKKYYYRIYGLKIESDFQMPQLIENDTREDTDVIIKHQAMPEEIHKSIKEGKKSYLTKEECWFIIKDVAVYRITNGKEIFIEEINGSFDDVKAFLLGSAFGCVFIQRNIVAIHGSTVIINDTGIIITGNMGAGKSTLTSGLILKGYKFLADDISTITDDESNQKMVSPAYPSQKLCRDAAIKFGLNISELIKTDKERDKFFVPALQSFINTKVNVKYIFEVALKDEDDKSSNIEIEELKGVKKLNAILRNIYRVEIATKIGMNTKYFKNVVSLAEQIEYYKIKRPRNLFTINFQIKAILNKVSS